MVYIDGIHMVADSIQELHQFAELIGLKRCWYHSSKTKPHYDIRKHLLQKAYDTGAVSVSSKSIVRMFSEGMIMRNIKH